MLIGVTEDPSFGPLLVFGLGGVYVELLKDVAVRIAPITDRDAAEMVGEIKTARLLQGRYRNFPPATSMRSRRLCSGCRRWWRRSPSWSRWT